MLLILERGGRCAIQSEMSLRTLTKFPNRSLVYFKIDKSTCIVDTKKLRKKDTGEPFTNLAPAKKAEVTYKLGSKKLEAIVIASDGKLYFHF